MKSLKLRLFSLFIVIVLRLSPAVAQASCPHYEGGSIVYVDFECTRTHLWGMVLL